MTQRLIKYQLALERQPALGPYERYNLRRFVKTAERRYGLQTRGAPPSDKDARRAFERMLRRDKEVYAEYPWALILYRCTWPGEFEHLAAQRGCPRRNSMLYGMVEIVRHSEGFLRIFEPCTRYDWVVMSAFFLGERAAGRPDFDGGWNTTEADRAEIIEKLRDPTLLKDDHKIIRHAEPANLTIH